MRCCLSTVTIITCHRDLQLGNGRWNGHDPKRVMLKAVSQASIIVQRSEKGLLETGRRILKSRVFSTQQKNLTAQAVKVKLAVPLRQFISIRQTASGASASSQWKSHRGVRCHAEIGVKA